MTTPALPDSCPDWLRRDLGFDAAGLLPLFADGRRIGWVTHEFALTLARWPGVFESRAGAAGELLAFRADLADPAMRSAALAGMLVTLRAEGRVRGWRDETYRVPPRGQGGELFRIERAARKLFGIESHAVHVNGWTRGPGGEARLWVARRSPAKSVDPDRWDNLVAGGISAATDAPATLVKECFEEAGLPPELAGRAVHGGTLAFARNDPEGVDVQRIEVYDLELPPGVEPRNQDGEVAEFRCLSIEEIQTLLERPRAFTVDAALVTLDALARRGP